jgi:hypothetical protein
MRDTVSGPAAARHLIAEPHNAALADLIGSISASLRNHVGKGIERTNDGNPARWQSKEAAN